MLPSSTNPTRPHTVNTVDEHLDMLMVCHHLNPRVPEDLAFAESRIRPSTIAAEDVLHDLGAISMIGSDSQAMGRIGEVDPPHLADRARDEGAPRRARAATVRPTTPRPAGTSRSTRSARRSPTASTREVGSVEVGKLADLVLWDPAFFGVRPHVVVKGGVIAWAHDGRRQRLDPDAAADAAAADVRRRAARRARHVSLALVAAAALDDGLAERLGRRRPLVPVADTRSLGKADMPENARDARHPRRPRHVRRARSTASWSTEQPAVELPMAQRYFLF